MSADDPEKVRDLQATARLLSDDARLGHRDSIGRLLYLIVTGSFVMSSGDVPEPGIDGDEEELTPAAV